MTPHSAFLAGLDLGKRQDYSALAILEYRRRRTGFDPVSWRDQFDWDLRVRRLTRFPLGTEYRDLVHRVESELRSPPLGLDIPLVVDSTGVGEVVCELLHGSLPNLVPVVITGGGRVTRAGAGYHVPKEALVQQLARLLEQDRLRVVRRLPLGPVLQQELRNFDVRIHPYTGRSTYGAFRDGEHDDLAMAVALACWYAPRHFPESPTAGAVPLHLFGA